MVGSSGRSSSMPLVVSTSLTPPPGTDSVGWLGSWIISCKFYIGTVFIVSSFSLFFLSLLFFPYTMKDYLVDHS